MRDRTRRGPRDRAASSRSLALGVAAFVLVAAVGLLLAGGGLPASSTGADATPTATASPDPTDAGSSPAGSPTDRQPGTATSTVETQSPTPTPRTHPEGSPMTGIERLANATTSIDGRGLDELGYSVATGDANGDGVPDVLVGAPLRNATGDRSGAAFLFYGPVAEGDLSTADADAAFTGEAGGDWAGNAVRLADVDADGTDDVVIGAPRNNAGGYTAGAMYVVHGGNLSGTVPLAEADERLVGPPESYAGYSIDAGDVVGGPGADLLVGAPRANASGAESGAAYLVSGDDLSGDASLAEATATFAGAGAGDRAGSGVAVAGDVDGDGRSDLAVGARHEDSVAENAGATYLLLGALDGRRSLADAAVTLTGTAAGDNAGFTAAGAGDVNGDGYADVLVGAPLDDAGGASAGAAYLVYGGQDLPGRLALPEAGATLVGASGGDRAGYSVAPAGDATCDGRHDLLVGAPGNATGGADAGAAYLVRGADLGNDTASVDDAVLALAGAAGDQVGRANQLAAFRGEDVAGLVVGAPFGRPGTAHVVYRSCPADPG